jgi:hypothetical protein
MAKRRRTRFAKLSAKLRRRKGVRNPDAVAAAIGRRKYGAKGMAKKAAAGRRRKKSARKIPRGKK